MKCLSRSVNHCNDHVDRHAHHNPSGRQFHIGRQFQIGCHIGRQFHIRRQFTLDANPTPTAILATPIDPNLHNSQCNSLNFVRTPISLSLCLRCKYNQWLRLLISSNSVMTYSVTRYSIYAQSFIVLIIQSQFINFQSLNFMLVRPE